jgi:hypothetical protein
VRPELPGPDGQIRVQWCAGAPGIVIGAADYLDEELLRVTVPDTGGAFGMRGMLFPEYAVVAAAALRAGRPVHWLENRMEHLQAGTHGRGMRHLPSDTRIFPDGSAETVWPASADRPFEMRAVYPWRAPHIVDVETVVAATAPLGDFDLFLASYFPDTFTEVRIPVHAPDTESGIRWVEAAEKDGDRQAFPRDAAATRLITDGRWDLEPHPIEWTWTNQKMRQWFVKHAP